MSLVNNGPDFKAVAAIVRNKSVKSVENFYMAHKKQVDAKIKEIQKSHEAEVKKAVTSFFNSLSISDR